MTLPSPVFSENEGNVFFIDEYSNVLYKYTDGEVTPYITFDFGEYNIKKKFFRFADTYKGMDYLLSQPFALVKRYYENEKFKFVEIGFQENFIVQHIYGVCRDNQWQWFSLGSPEDGILAANVRALSSNALYFVIKPSDLDKLPKDYIEKMTNPECLDEISPKDNYVIVKITLK